jgi:histidinol-phosphate aminotransferase
LTDALAGFGVAAPESHANFVLADLGRPVADIDDHLVQRGILVRANPWNAFPHCLRISIGPAAHIDRVIAALRERLSLRRPT